MSVRALPWDAPVLHVLGADAVRLDPVLADRYALGGDEGVVGIAHGVMTEIRVGPAWLRPLLALATRSGAELPSRGHHVPFELENVPGRGDDGRATLEFRRRFRRSGRDERFTTRMSARGSGAAARVVDAFGRDGRLEFTSTAVVTPTGGLHLVADGATLRVAGRRIRLPLALVGRTFSRESVGPAPTDGAAGPTTIGIVAGLRHPVLGLVVGYRGHYRLTRRPG